MKYPLIFLVALVLIGSSSCYKIYCNYPSIELQFTGFDTSDMARVVLNRYRKDGNFSSSAGTQTYIQTFNLALVTPLKNVPNADTVIYYGTIPGITLDADYDYAITVLATAHTYRVKGISFGNESTQAGNSAGCTRSASWYLDSQLQKYLGYYYSDGYVQIAIAK